VVGFVAELQQFDPTALNPDPDLYGSEQSPVVPVGSAAGVEPSVVSASVEVGPTDLYAALADPSLDESDPQPTDLYAVLAEPLVDNVASAVSSEAAPGVSADSAFAWPASAGVASAGAELPRPRRYLPATLGPATGRVVLEVGPERAELTPAPIDITPGAARPPSSAGGLRRRIGVAGVAWQASAGELRHWVQAAVRTGAAGSKSSTGGQRRRIRVAMLAGAAVAALVAGGVGYAALNQPGTATAAPEPRTSISALPTLDGRIGARVSRAYRRPPVDKQLSASASRTSAPAPSEATEKSAGGGVVPVAPGRSTSPAPARTTPAQDQPPVQAEPGPGGGPGQGGGQRSLAATFTHTGEGGRDGVSNYTGTIRVDNFGRRPVDGWQVDLEVPGGNSISTDGAGSAQDGDHVTFTPFDGAGTISPGDSVTFTFTVYGVLPAEPSGCTVNGRACD
jgi:Cellulose binding domain